MAPVPGMVPRKNSNRPREANSAADRQAYQDRLGRSRGDNPDKPKSYPGGQGKGEPNNGPARPGQPKPKGKSSKPRTGGSEAPVQRGPHTSPYHPDGRTKDPYTDPRNPSTGGSKKSSKPVGGSHKVPGLVPAPSIGGKKSAFGDSASQFEKDRQDWARNHPDNKGKDKVPAYTPPKKSIPSPKKIPSLGPGSVLKGTSAVHGMLPRY